MPETLDVVPNAEVNTLNSLEDKVALDGIVVMLGSRIKLMETPPPESLSFDERRFRLAEERTGEIIVRVENKGFHPLSEIYRVGHPSPRSRVPSTHQESSIHPNQYRLL